MPFWFTLLFYIGTFLVSELLRPKPNLENAKPAGLGDFQFPTAEEGRVVPLVWGTVRINGPNIGWFGDLSVKEIKEKVKTGLFSSKRVTVGFEYSVGLQFLLCRGEFATGEGIRRIWVDDEVLRPAIAGWTNSGTISINDRNFFGKDSGGIAGTLRVFPGSGSQSQSSYMAGVANIDSTLLPAYRGTAYLLLERAYIGNAPSIRPWAFEVRRIPDPLDLENSGDSPQARHIVNDDDANPMNVLYEVLTNSDWGLGLSNVNLSQFKSVGSILWSEGNGYSRVLDRAIQAAEIIAEIEQQCDGVLVQNPTTKNYEFKLIRESDYPSPVTDVPLFDESNSLEFEFTRGSWFDTTNQVRVQYNDRDKNFKSTFALAQDMANRLIQGTDNVSTTINYPGVADADLANSLAWRDIRTLAYPLAKAKLKATRAHYTLQPGDLVRVTWGVYNIESMFFRINRVQLGSLEANEIIYDLTEDIFERPVPTFAAPEDTLWAPETTDAVDVAEARVWQVPPQYSTDQFRQQIGVMAVRANGLQTSYDAWYAQNATALQSPANDGAELAFNINVAPFTPSALLRDPLPVTQQDSPPSIGFDNDTIIVDTGTDLDLVNLTAILSDLNTATPPNLALVGDEVIFFTSMTDIGGGEYQLNNVRRGMLDTKPLSHDANTRVWFFTYGMGVLEDINPVTGQQGVVAFVSNSVGETQEVADAVKVDFTITNRYQGASAPVNPEINGVRIDNFNSGLSGGLLQLYWRGRNSLFGTERDKTQEGESEDPGGGTTYTARVYHTGVSPETLVYTRGGIPYAGSGISPEGGQVNIAGYLYDPSANASPLPSPRVPQTYRVELEARRSNYISQKWEGEVTVTGWGFSYGGVSAGVVLQPGDPTPSPQPDNPVEGGYGGINFQGSVLNQGDAPVVVEPVPGLTNPSIVIIDVGGTYNSADNGRFDVTFYNTIENEFTVFSANVNAATAGSLEGYAEQLAGILTSNLDANVVTVNRFGTQVEISTFYGSLSVDYVNTGVGGTGGIAVVRSRQLPAGPSTGVRQSVYLDYWTEQFDPLTGSRLELLAPSSSPNYASGAGVNSKLVIVGTTHAARKEIAENLNQPNNGFTLLATEPAVGSQYSGVMQALFDEIKALGIEEFFSVGGPLVLSSGGSQPDDSPQQRASIRLTAKGNYEVQTQFFSTTQPNTSHEFKLLWKEGRQGSVEAPSGLPKVVRIVLGQTAAVSLGDLYIIEVNNTRVTEAAIAADVANNNLNRIYDALAASLVAALPATYSIEVIQTSANIAIGIEVVGPNQFDYQVATYMTHGPAGIEVDVTET